MRAASAPLPIPSHIAAKKVPSPPEKESAASPFASSLLPGALYDISPFHCSMYITNIASIGLPAIYHHLYNFGNTSVFLAMGKFEKQLTATKDGPAVKTVIPLGLTLDERICGGADFARCIAYYKKLLANPELLETRPESVKLEVPMKD